MTVTPPRATGAVGVVVALVVATEIGRLQLLEPGISLWWLPSAVIATYVLTDRLSVTLPVLALGSLVAGVVTTRLELDALPHVILSSAGTTLSYGVAAWLLWRIRRDRTGRLVRVASFVVAMVLVGPSLAAVTTHLAGVLLGTASLAEAALGVPRTAVADAAAIMGLVPAARTALADEWAGADDRRTLITVGSLVAVGFAVGALSPGWSVQGHSLVYLLGIPMLLASSARHDWIVRVTVAATGVGIAVGLSNATPAAAVAVQVSFLGLAIIASVLTALAHTTGIGRDVRTVLVGGVAIAGRHQVLAGVSRITRRIRGGLVVVLVIDVAMTYRDGWAVEGLPLWAAAIGAPLLLVVVNAMSLYFDAVQGQTRRRQWFETAADVTVVVALGTVFAPLIEVEVLVLIEVVVLVAAALRLKAADALAVGLIQLVAVTTLPSVALFPWSQGATAISATRVAAQAVIAVLVVWLVSWTSDQLHASRDQIAALAAEQAILNDRLTASNDELGAAYATLADRSAQLERAEADAREAADEERRARDDYERFAALVAHDLASPLATVSGIVTLLQRTEIDEDSRVELLRSALNSSRRASALIERLHEHARAGSWSLDPAPIPISDLAEEVVLDHRAAIEATGSTVEVARDLPIAECDHVLVHQLLSNLVGNALRHGADDDGVARVRIAAAIDDDGMVAVTVGDDGPGIAPELAASLYTIGVRGDRSRGLGLGMSTCRTVAERHGGTITVGDGPAGGAEVTFTLPSAVQRPVVLLVEQDDDVRRRWSRRIGASCGVEIVEARNIAEASALMETLQLDAAFVDVDLPDGTGLDLLADLTRMQIPTRLVSAHVRRADVAAAARYGTSISRKATFAENLDVEWALARTGASAATTSPG